MNFVLIDYENVQPEVMGSLDREDFNVIVFVGASQAKVSYSTASVLQQMGDRASYVKVAGHGSNALDFHIAYYIGQLSAKDPSAHFHIVSKDTGFDPLIEHLRGKKIRAHRSKSVSEMELPKDLPPKTGADRASAVLTYLERIPKPRTVKTLGSAINALYQKSLSQKEIEQTIADLANRGAIEINESRVSYGGSK